VDKSNGYEAIAGHFIAGRNQRIGPSTVREWSKRLPRGAEILELACGHGVVSQVLIDEGFPLWAIDASPTILAKFRERFPHVPTECAAAEESDYFGRTYDAIVAWGLIFLLPEATQRALIHKMARALNPGGRLLFTSEENPLEWDDAMTDQHSSALGRDAYIAEIEAAGLVPEGNDKDIGNNYYFFARKP
jgi:cyclopropane fatty-acyl-phospholipid synthase-like methyltransferase